MNQKGFANVAFIVLVVVLAGVAGYLGVKQYQHYQIEKIEREKEAQKKYLEEAQQENREVGQSKNRVTEPKEGKDNQQVEESTVALESEGSQLCKPLFKELSGKSKYDKINVVFVGFGYHEDSDVPPKEAVPLLANVVVDPLGKNHGLFSVEPFKSNRDKFNFWYVDKLGEMKLKDCGNVVAVGLCLQNTEALFENCTVPNKFVVNFVNKIGVVNLGGIITTISAPTGMDILKSPINLVKLAEIFVHELGGHAIGRLLDEYDFSYPGQRFEGIEYSIEGRANQSNCYAGPKHTSEEAAQNAQWRHLIGNGCGKDGVIDCSEKDANYNLEIGVFEGCAGYSFGIFRPTRNSIMNNSDFPPYSFGPWNEQLIRDRLNLIIPRGLTD